MSAKLFEAAREAAKHAYAPYSGYSVGAALRDEQGRVWAGCNVENVSYGLTICAERNAIAAMVAGGSKRVQEILVLTADAAAPCGACLQVLAEFASSPESLTIHLANQDGTQSSTTLHALLPGSFKSSKVRTNAT